MINYTYQTTAASIVLRNALNTKFKASILAACPGAGKTTISHIILNEYFKLNPQAKVIVLTEGQNTLLKQYVEELKTPNTKINFTFGVFGSNSQVEIGIPQGILNTSHSKIDLLIVDEAHNYYLEEMVTNIIKNLKPKHQILMTGSPTKFNYINEMQGSVYAIHYIPADELMKQGVFNNVDMDVVRVKDKKNAPETIKNSLLLAKKYDLTKIMIACPSIAYAKEVSKYLLSIGRKVSLSDSFNDKEDVEIEKFKNNETDALIVVGRGILGFNDKNITALFDLRSSSNLDASYQLFARVLRKHPKNIRKAYLRVADKDYNKEVITLHKMTFLMQGDIFRKYNGKNLGVSFF